MFLRPARTRSKQELLWLCALEAGQAGNGAGAEIDATLANAHAPMEAFVAAALDLQAGDACAAVAHLSTAGQRADPVVFRYLPGDPTFAELRTRP